MNDENLEMLGSHIERLIVERAASENWEGPFGELWHSIDECNLLEEKKDEWREFLCSLLAGSGELQKALKAQREAMQALHCAVGSARKLVDLELGKHKFPLLPAEVKA